MDLRAFWIRLTHWEYWPFEIVYLPVFAYWLWLSVRARSLLYFTASNTLMENGGMLGESKADIFNRLPREYIPNTLFVDPSSEIKLLEVRIRKSQLHFPVIVKPNIGERGAAVEKILDFAALINYHELADYNYLIQEYIDLPLETGVFYYRFPNNTNGTVSSIVYKELLSVTGNGVDTLKQLVHKKDRAYLQHKVLRERFCKNWESIPSNGETVMLEEIGNHSRGTKFLSGNQYITKRLTETFDQVVDQMEGFYFGRFDIRSASWEDLEEGRFLILELNGGGSEPGHIYDPGISIIEAYGSIFHHWKVLYDISRANHAKGIPYLTFREGLQEYRKVLDNKRRISRQ
jgi:D-alanine-D-alanine ligase-like ATP-grasp enzyme